MHSVETILRQLTEGKNADTVRWAIVALVREQLHDRQQTLDDWEAAHFANAITMLTMNASAVQQPTTAWLRLCLVDLRLALTPPAERHAHPPVRKVENERITYAQLTERFDTAVRMLDRRNTRSAASASFLRRYLDRISGMGNVGLSGPTARQPNL